MRLGINIGLAIIVIFLAYILGDSVYTEIHFNEQYNKRATAIQDRFDLFKDLQEKYKSQKEKFASSFKEFENFIEKDSFELVTLKTVGFDAENEPIYDSTFKYIAVKDSLKLDIASSDLKFIPYSPTNAKFEIEAKKIQKGRYDVDVFIISAPFKSFLNDFDNDRYDQNADFHIGSLSEQTYAGNW